MEIRGRETRGEAGRICGTNWNDKTAPGAAVLTSHGLSLECVGNVTVVMCLCMRDDSGNKVLAEQGRWLVKVPLL